MLIVVPVTLESGRPADLRAEEDADEHEGLLL